MRGLILGAAIMTAAATGFAGDKATSPLSYTMKSLDGKDVDLSKFKGKVVLIVNTASKCGLTPQYKGLEALNDKYGKDGLVILGFPANDFGRQEPGTDDEISDFCTKNYGVSFNMFSKVVVKGDGQCDLYKLLTTKENGGPITWNFEKFLIGKDGNIVKRFSPRVPPEDPKVVAEIESELKK